MELTLLRRWAVEAVYSGLSLMRILFGGRLSTLVPELSNTLAKNEHSLCFAENQLFLSGWSLYSNTLLYSQNSVVIASI